MTNLPVTTKAKDLFWQEPSMNSPQRRMFKDFYDVEDKVSYLTNNKEYLEKEYNINVINLINAWMNNDWPQKREKQNAN